MVMAPIDRKFPRPVPMPLPAPWPSQDSTVDNAVFDMLDGSGDDNVSKDEWSKAGWTADRFTAFDGNGDGKVSRKEFTDARRFEREFNQKDMNQDGQLSRAEMMGYKYYATHGLSKAAEAVGGAAKGILRCMPFMDRFTKFDTDKSGGVSKEEYIKGRRSEETRIIWDRPVLTKPAFDKREMLLASAAEKKAANA